MGDVPAHRERLRAGVGQPGAAPRRLLELDERRLLDEALGALVARHRAAEIDEGYLAYERSPLDGPDEWGDLASFRAAAGAS